MRPRIAARLRWLRRAISRSEWAVRLLGLSRSSVPAAEPGLIMVQIDGLSRRQFERALEQDRLPFLDKLRTRDGYRVHTLYSGLPSTTPSVQGELFYGVRPAVPAFSFLSHRHGRTVKMLQPEVVAPIQEDLEARGTGLFEGGSVYSNIYSGGAEEAHFCAATFGWSGVIQALNPFRFILLILFNLGSVIRATILMVVELCLALVDFFRGTLSGQSIRKELTFVPTRVLICILLRELITGGAMIDAARGLPVIHLNYLGYDEQAHRRGPDSDFAHWTLKGIDDAIRRLYEAANRSTGRAYDLWIYADHGQEHTVPYVVEIGKPLREVVQEIFSGSSTPLEGEEESEGGVRSQRARYLMSRLDSKRRANLPPSSVLKEGSGYTLCAMGPIGHINFGPEFDRSRLPVLAERLAIEGGVPAVLALEGSDRIRAWTGRGVFMLPEERDEVLGENHPFRAELATELMELCLHPDAGDLVLLGWRPGGRPLSFPIENGAHAGPGPEETRAFALLPSDAPLIPESGRSHIRPFDLREAALRYLGRTDEALYHKPIPFSEAPLGKLRVLTYHVNGCKGRDGVVSPRRIARVIARRSPDLICLQGLRGKGQAESIASALRLELHQVVSIHLKETGPGEAILSRYPLEPLNREGLPTRGRGASAGRDRVTWVRVKLGGALLNLANAHLSPRRRERDLQLKTILESCGSRVKQDTDAWVVCANGGVPLSPGLRRLARERDYFSPSRAIEKRIHGRASKPPARCGLAFSASGLPWIHADWRIDGLTHMASESVPLLFVVRTPGMGDPAQETSRSC